MQVDIQVVSIDPVKTEIKKGSQVTIYANIRNNGPDPVLRGECKLHATINGRFVNKPTNFRSVGTKFKLEIIKKEGDNYELFAVNTAAMPVNEPGFPGVKFSVKGKAKGIVDILINGMLSATSQSSETDGNNNDARTELIVK